MLLAHFYLRGIRRRLAVGVSARPTRCADEIMVESNSDECSVPNNGGQEGVGVDNRGMESDSDASDTSEVSDVEEYDDVTTDGNALALTDVQKEEERLGFGNIAVTNSTDIHFGNKTFYQGPVTIKQLVYTRGSDDDASVFKDSKKPGESIGDQLKILSSAEANAKDRIVQIPIGLGKPGKQKVPLRVMAVSLTLVLSVVIAVVTVAVVLILTSKANQKDGGGNQEKRIEIIDNIPPNANYPFHLSGKLRILSRKQWLAQPTVKPPQPLELPVPYVIISHTASDNCSSQSECTFMVRTTQSFHIDSWGWNDIAYNFLVGGDGYAYEGRGWDSVGAHTYGYNVCSIGISFVGTFVNLHPPARQMLAARQLIEMGVQLGKIRSDYFLIGHRQASATESPGQALFDEIKTLPHWKDAPVKCDDLHKKPAEK